jgi:hypothetical protein
MEKERQDALAARLKAGEVGATPDPVEDRRQMLLDSAYQNFFNAFNKAPSSMEEMVRAGYLGAVPPLPPGKKYKIDPNGAGIKIE